MIETRDLTKAYGRRMVVDHVTMTVEQGEFIALLGPTGCGKTTILRLIAGLEDPTSGVVLLDGVDTSQIPARDRGLAMVFQEFAPYPHMSVAENIAAPMRFGASGAETAGTKVLDRQRVAEVAAELGIGSLLDRRPDQLSGGQRQRVAVARAIVRRPRAFLLDEPLSQLDAHLRIALREEIAALAKRLGVTTIYVTHDQSEALMLASRIVVLNRGRVHQIGTPQEVRTDPDDVFVASFVSSAQTTLVQGAVYAGKDGAAELDMGSQSIVIPASDPAAAGLVARHTERVTVALRSEAMRPCPVDAAGAVLRGTVAFVEDLGAELLVHVATDLVALPPPQRAAPVVERRRLNPIPRQRQAEAAFEEPEEPLRHLVVRAPSGARPAIGSAFAVEVDLRRLFLFDRNGYRLR
ncbi:multiple sugar transport system ATP-binding protein [Allocatelliglobosispora scoriae]|uniref:Multiple sugar transport system ATP-binding protein n=1 Tax=Allocatelliglobosispora scoriae TaxID=643052 RepID=A0A841BWG3_9ACTN|nr:ABC transporter ATP-binding protein [Allocatelliglobosispora scoriae]MBB5871818.1 multiple sugar transport system ATP-binding protein [Allocatelliglobosispora scoriae]